MGLKGYRLWVMGQLDSTCKAPPRAPPCRMSPRRGSTTQTQAPIGRRRNLAHAIGSHVQGGPMDGMQSYTHNPPTHAVHRLVVVAARALLLGVALQVAFERQTLKPVFSLDRV
jgi:hypothetical protein